MARRKTLKWQKWEKNHADAGRQTVLRFCLCDQSCKGQPVKMNTKRRTCHYLPSSVSQTALIINQKLLLCAEPSPLPRSDRMTPWYEPLVKLCFGISNHTCFKKKHFQSTNVGYLFLKTGQIFKVNHLKKTNKQNFRACRVLVALQSVSGNGNFNMKQ